MSWLRRLLLNDKYRRGFFDWTFVVVGSCGIAGYGAAHTAGLTYIKEFVHFYKEGKPVKMDEHVSILAEMALNDVKISRREKTLVEFFPLFGDEMFHFGSTKFTQGAIIGIPHHFVFREQKDIIPSEISIFNQDNIPWDSVPGNMLLDGLLLSDSAKKFAILREIYSSSTFKPLALGSVALTALLLGRALSNWIVDRPNYTKNIPRPLRPLVHLASATFTYVTYCRFRDFIHQRHEFKADKMAITTLTGAETQAREGPEEDKEKTVLDKAVDKIKKEVTEPRDKNSISDDYFSGGIEYYSKNIARNKAYRRLLGKEGPNYFTRDGDERWTLIKWLIRPAPVSFNDRIKYMQNIVDFHQSDEDPNKTASA